MKLVVMGQEMEEEEKELEEMEQEERMAVWVTNFDG